MKSTLAALKAKFDVVIIDTAPLLPVADGAITASAADGAILLVRHGRTTTDQFSKALAALDQVHARLLGTVLNYAPNKRRIGGYGYGYGYGGYGYSAETDTKKRRFGFGRKKKDTIDVTEKVTAPAPQPATDKERANQ